MLELKFVDHIEMERENSQCEKDIYTIGGYTVIRTTEIDEDGHEEISIYVRVTNPKDDTSLNRYLPDIYFDDGLVERTAPSFRIQTTSYGVLSKDEYTNFLAAQWQAFDVVTTLTGSLIK